MLYLLHFLLQPDLDELVVLLAGEVPLLGLVVLAGDDHGHAGHPAAPAHAHVHTDPGLKIRSRCPMTHEVSEMFTMTLNININVSKTEKRQILSLTVEIRNIQRNLCKNKKLK